MSFYTHPGGHQASLLDLRLTHWVDIDGFFTNLRKSLYPTLLSVLRMCIRKFTSGKFLTFQFFDRLGVLQLFLGLSAASFVRYLSARTSFLLKVLGPECCSGGECCV